MNDTPMMPLNKALHILTEAHTRDNEQSGFTVETLPQVFEWGHADYIEAWRSVRYNTGKQTEPLLSEGVQFHIAKPKSWDEGTVTFIPYWTAAAGTARTNNPALADRMEK